MKASFVLFCLFQTEKPERRHTFASLALRKRYSYLTDPAASEFAILTYMKYELILDTNVILISLVKRSNYTVCKYTYIPYFFSFFKKMFITQFILLTCHKHFNHLPVTKHLHDFLCVKLCLPNSCCQIHSLFYVILHL